LSEEKPSILAIGWDFWSLWPIIPLLAKQAKAGSEVSVITMNQGPPPEKPLHGMPTKGEYKRAWGGYTSGYEEFKAAFEILNIHDVRFLGLGPMSRLAGNIQKSMLTVTRIIREIRPDIILMQDPYGPHMPGWLSWFYTMMERAIREAAGNGFHQAHDDRYPDPNPYMQRIELEHFDLPGHRAKEIYYWLPKSEEINYAVDTSDVVDDVVEFTKRVHYFKDWKPPHVVVLKRQLGPKVSQYLEVSEKSIYSLLRPPQ